MDNAFPTGDGAARPAVPRVVVAPDSFKGSATAADAARAIAAGWTSVRPYDEILLRPMADGGEGTLDAFAAAVPGAERRAVVVAGPAGGEHAAEWLLLPDGTAVVELAATSGLTLLDRPRPLEACTRGFGQAIGAALDAGAERLLLALGGSGSTDGGTGALAALGARFLRADGEPIAPGGGGLAELDRVELGGLRSLPPGGATILGDVTNPLLGAEGAAAVFGPQKGAEPAQIDRLERGLARLAERIPGGAALAAATGAGAAGGTGFGLLVWGARMSGGAAAVAEAIGLDAALGGARIVITGEGRYDRQSAAGKVPSEVAARAAVAGVPVALVAGRIDAETSAFRATASLSSLAGSGARAMADPLAWLRAAGVELARAR
ncbi:glycerate kinase [Agromyces mediolanus]|uniref:glycerate kinase n=1 Tax=Agromyces mediolanus TaxID=41986 RepID=UPI002041F995|nr:glycerate kinase [Agromyces mediolanus]MCM3657337.1 glycerate kinase [Agromyces mediolanus]